MRALVFALAVMMAGVTAWPQTNYGVVNSDSRHITGDIFITLIEEYIRLVRDRGLDPYFLESIEGSYALPVDGLFSASGSVSGVSLEGISNVVINSINSDEQTGEVSYDLAYSYVSGSVADAFGEVNILDYNLAGEGSGSLTIVNLRVQGSVSLSASPIDGINIESLAVTFTVDSIQSNLNLVLLGYDVSDTVNNFLSVTLPEFFITYKEEISTVVDYVVRYFVNPVL